MSWLSQKVRQKLRNMLQKRGYCINRLTHVHFLEPLLYRQLEIDGDLVFVQIGANDGVSFDPIYQFVTRNRCCVRGIVVEPLSDYFQQLKVNYAGYPNITPVNVAIHRSKKEMSIYRVDSHKLKDFPRWAKGIASFNQNHYKLSGIPDEAIVAEKVRCMTFSELLANHQISKVDLIQIDTEGYDAEILQDIDFNTIQPNIIRFEHGLADGIMSRETFSNIVEMLHDHGYELVVEPYDATAYHREILIEP